MPQFSNDESADDGDPAKSDETAAAKALLKSVHFVDTAHFYHLEIEASEHAAADDHRIRTGRPIPFGICIIAFDLPPDLAIGQGNGEMMILIEFVFRHGR